MIYRQGSDYIRGGSSLDSKSGEPDPVVADSPRGRHRLHYGQADRPTTAAGSKEVFLEAVNKVCHRPLH